MFHVIRFVRFNNSIKEYAPEFAGSKEDCDAYIAKTALAKGEDFVEVAE